MADMHVNTTKNTKRYTIEEDEIIRKYYTSNGGEYVSNMLIGRNKQSVHNRAFKLGIKYLEYNKDFFELIDTEEKAYWLGFIYADGYVTTNNRFGIALSQKDTSHLEKFCKSIEYNGKIRTRERKVSNKGYNFISEETSITINNSKLFNDLVDKGVNRNKSKMIHFPSEKILPISLRSHFIRGFFDGDGTVFIGKYGESTQVEMSIVCYTYSFLETIQEILNHNGISTNKITEQREHHYVLKVTSGTNIKKMIEYLYRDSEYYLDRKFIKASEVLEYIKTASLKPREPKN